MVHVVPVATPKPFQFQLILMFFNCKLSKVQHAEIRPWRFVLVVLLERVKIKSLASEYFFFPKFKIYLSIAWALILNLAVGHECFNEMVVGKYHGNGRFN